MNGLAPPELSILIPSIGRPDLVRTVQSARQAAIASGLSYEIVVADDGDGDRLTMVVAQGQLLGDDLRIVPSKRRNLAQTRNICLGQSSGALLAFIDDDEWAEPTWLVDHLAALEGFAADAVIGRVVAHYPPDAPAWFVRADVYSRGPGPAGARLRGGTTANAMIRRASLDERGISFDDRFGLSGGEDTDLFARLARGGGVIVASDATVHEQIPPARCEMDDLRRRAIRSGQTYAHAHLGHAGRLRRFADLLDSVAKVVLSSIGAAITRPVNRSTSMILWLKGARNLGKCYDYFDRPVLMYYARPEVPSETTTHRPSA